MLLTVIHCPQFNCLGLFKQHLFLRASFAGFFLKPGALRGWRLKPRSRGCADDEGDPRLRGDDSGSGGDDIRQKRGGRPPPFTLIPKIQVKVAPAFQGMQTALNESPCLGIVARNSEILGFDIL